MTRICVLINKICTAYGMTESTCLPWALETTVLDSELFLWYW